MLFRSAEAGAVDEVSLGSSDLSQRYYGKAEEFEKRKNDGGVPYKDKNELRLLYLATRRGNFPAIKPYAHVSAIESFIDDCVEVGMLKGAHQAIPLFWFNELDGRGETQLEDSIREHIRAVKKLAALGIPVEMNDPNQWSSRWAHDTVIAADYGLMIRPWRFNELHRDLEGISQKVLTESLRSMESDGIIIRTVYQEVPPKVEYSLSDLGESMRPILKSMEAWGDMYKKSFDCE